jgi:hypothetical protein
MLTFKEMRFEVTESGGIYMMLRNQDAKEGERCGAHFMWSKEEWEALVRPTRGGMSLFRDGYHLCDASWPGVLTFIDTDRVSELRTSLGKAEVSVFKMEITTEVLVIIDERLKQAIAEADRGERWHDGSWKRRPFVEVSVEDRAHWLGFYGQAKGSVTLRIDQECADRLEQDCLADERDNVRTIRFPAETSIERGGDVVERRRSDGPGLRAIVEQWKNIARNSTWKADERATLSISRDGDGYFVNALTPSGSSRLHGGWVKHYDYAPGGKDRLETYHWSAHT